MWYVEGQQLGKLSNKNRQGCRKNAAKTRASTSGKLIEKGFLNLTRSSSINDATRLWNSAPNQIKESDTIYSEKKCIKDFVKTLPL